MIVERTFSALPGTRRTVGLLSRIVSVVSTWTARRVGRRALARLDDHLLRDIGLSDTRARDEALKHFWLE